MAAIVVAMLFLLALTARNVSLGSPIMAGDEYAYLAQAREFPSVTAVLAYDPTIQRTDNVFYLWIGHLVWRGFADPAQAMRVLQSTFYLCILLAAFGICRRFTGPWRSTVIAVVACASAMSSYSAYFMPETLYQLLFFILALLLVSTLPRWPLLGAAGCGLVAALLLLTKPNGVAIALAAAATLLLAAAFPKSFGGSRRRSLAACVTFATATYIFMVGINGVLTRQWRFSPLLFVGTYYQDVLSSSATLPSWSILLRVILGNSVALGMLAGIPLVCIGCSCCLVSCQAAAAAPAGPRAARDAGFVWLSTFAVCSLAFAVAMTVRFTVGLGTSDMWRIHGRYYSFAIALCIVTMGIGGTIMRDSKALSARLSLVLRAAAVLGIVVFLAAQFWWRRTYAIAPWDFPEIWPFATSDFIGDGPGIGSVLAIGGCCGCLGILIRPHRAPTLFLIFFAALNIANVVQVTRWQFAHSRSFAPYSQPARAVRLLVAGPELDHGVVIGPDRGILTYTLFNLRSRSHVLLLPRDSTVSLATVGVNADWVLAQGRYRLDLPGRVVVKTARLTLVALHPLPAFEP